MTVLQLAVGVVNSLTDQTVSSSSNYQFELSFNKPVKQIQIEYTIADSTSCNIQLYETLDFTDVTFVSNVASGVGSSISYNDLTGSSPNVLLKYNNYDAVNNQVVTAVSVLGIADSD